jgi:hypothetical protein
MSYAPAAGTIAGRIIEHMRRSTIGTHFTPQELADAAQCAAGSMSTYLATALRHKLVARIALGGGRTAFALLPGDAFEADEARGGRPQQTHVDAAAAPAMGKVGPASVFELGGVGAPPPADTMPAETPFKRWLEKRGEPSAEGPPRRRRAPSTSTAVIERIVVETPPELSCALFNTGDLVLEIPGTQPLRLSARQAADLVRYLKRAHPLFA